MQCSECDRPAKARGYCGSHYYRWSRRGPEGVSGPIGLKCSSADESFEKRTERQGDCLVWTGATNALGYGVIVRDDGRTQLAHRWHWERKVGPLAPGVELDHACHAPACTELEHLREATSGQNKANRAGAQTNSRTGVRNVRRRRGRLEVRVTREGVTHRRGPFPDTEAGLTQAEAAASELREELFGGFAGKGRIAT